MGVFEITCLIMCWVSVSVCLFGLIFSVVECIRSRREEKRKERAYLTQREIEKFVEVVKKKRSDHGHDSMGDNR